jgi:hypothetical protein
MHTALRFGLCGLSLLWSDIGPAISGTRDIMRRATYLSVRYNNEFFKARITESASQNSPHTRAIAVTIIATLANSARNFRTAVVREERLEPAYAERGVVSP